MSGSNSKLSSKLKQLRFMQRAAKKQEQEEVVAEEQAATKSVSLGDGLGVSQSNWIAQASKKMCVVLRTSDPAPKGLGGGKMSFGKKQEPIDVEKEQEDAVMSGLTDAPNAAVEMKGKKKRKQQESHVNSRLTKGSASRPDDGKKSKHGKQHRKKTKN